MTGFKPVFSILTSLAGRGSALALSPPVHPLCARRLRSIPVAPCRTQWRIHLRGRSRSHVCPIGLRCSCVPIRLGGQLVGLAKLVVDDTTPDEALEVGVRLLTLMVTASCQESTVAMLSEEVSTLRQRVKELQQIQADGRLNGPDAAGKGRGNDDRSAALVDRALAYLERHYRDPELSLQSVGRALGSNPRYLTTRFTLLVGERMHLYLTMLRVSHACRLLVESDLLVKEVAIESGFSGTGQMASAIRRHVGVSPKVYRRIFAAPI